MPLHTNQQSAPYHENEYVWDLMIRARQLTRATPLLERVLSRVTRTKAELGKEGGAASSSTMLTEVLPLENSRTSRGRKPIQEMIDRLRAKDG
jgi:hypothetical protein